MPRLTIVIPWTGPLGPFEETLAAVLQNRPSGCEILVALAQPYDDPHGVAEEVTFVPPQTGTTDVVSLVNAAIAAAQSPVVQIVPCGLLVTEDWSSAALMHFAETQIAAVAPVLKRAARPDRVLAAGVELSPYGGRKLLAAGRKHIVAELVQLRPLAAPLAGGFFRKSVVEALGGFDARLGPHAADLDFALCAAHLGYRTECEPTSVIIAGSHVADDGSFATGRGLERLFWRHLNQEDRRDKVPGHYFRLLGELAYAAVQPQWLLHAAGRTAGWLGASFDRDHAERLAVAQERLAEPTILALPQSRSTYRRAA